MENKAFTVNSHNIKQVTGIQVTFISENKLKKYDCFYGDLCVCFELMLAWECAYACYD